MKAKVYVTLKAGVFDPQGQAVHDTLSRLGFNTVADVRIGKFVEIELMPGSNGKLASLDDARAQVEEMCRKLIANTVIEDFRVEMIE